MEWIMNTDSPIQTIRILVQRHPASPCMKQKDTQFYANGPQLQGLDWAHWAMQMFQCWGWRCQMRRMWWGIALGVCGVGVGGGSENSTLRHQQHVTQPRMHTHKYTQTQELVEAQVVPREAWTFYWCWVMLTTSQALQDRDQSIGWGCHKRSHMRASHSVLHQFL